MGQETGGSEPESLLRQCICLLSLRNFCAARKHSLSARRSYPSRPEFAQVLAVADVHLAAEKRLPGQQCDWFSILRLEPPLDGVGGNQLEVKTQVQKLLTLLNPKANNLPFAQNAFELACNARSEISNPQKKTHLQNEPKTKAHNHMPHQMQEKSGSGEKKMGDGSFWTLCPYCYYLYEYEAVYEDCSLRCQNCRRGFHGVVVRAPEDGMMVEGKGQYYCGFGCFPLKYNLVGPLGDNNKNWNGGDTSFLDEKKGNSSELKAGFDDVVEISDDSDEDSRIGKTGKGEIGKNDGVALEQETVKKVMVEVQGSVRVAELGTLMQGTRRIEIIQNGRKVIRNVKSVAGNTKKMMGTGKKYRRIEAGENQRMEEAHANVELGDGASGIGGENGTGAGSNYGYESLDGDLKFFVGDDDIYVSIHNAD